MFAQEGLAKGNACLFAKIGGLVDMVHDNGFLFFAPVYGIYCFNLN